MAKRIRERERERERERCVLSFLQEVCRGSSGVGDGAMEAIAKK
jgi:hypothetical protein